MKTLTVRIETADAVKAAVLASMKSGRSDPAAGLSFQSYEQMHRILSPKRMEIVKTMTGAGVLTIREVARRAGRDFKGVHTDVTVLVNAGVIDRAAGGVIFPYDAIHVEFNIPAAA